MRLIGWVVAVAVFLMVAWMKADHVDVTCGGYVSTPPLERVIEAGEAIGDVIHRFRDGVSTMDEVVAAADIQRAWMLFHDALYAHANNKPESFGVLSWKKKFADTKANALAGCALTDGGSSSDGGSCPTGNPDPAIVTASQRNLTGQALALAVAQKYFPRSEWPMAVRVEYLESGYRTDAYNGIAGGLFAINLGAHPDLVGGRDWKNPWANGWMAQQIWLRAGRSWSPDWTTAPAARRSLDTSLGQAPRQSPDSLGTPCTDQLVSTQRFTNPRTPDQAIAWLSGQGRVTPRNCLGYVVRAYGHRNSGKATAMVEWAAIPAWAKHTGVPPRGALVFWRTGSAGHVAISAGGGRVVSTDFNGRRYQKGSVGVGPIEAIDGWGKRLGWTVPFFPGRSTLTARRGVPV